MSNKFLQGSFECGPCPFGFTGTGLAGCTPGDYCLLGLDNCHTQFGLCESTGPGLFKCKVSPYIMLVQKANVVYRSFVVQCKPGYGGTGVFCALDSDQDGIPDNAISGCSDPLCKKVSPVPSIMCTLHKTLEPSYVSGQLPYDTKWWTRRRRWRWNRRFLRH